MRNKIARILILCGILAQALVPMWMLLKRHVILTKGETVTVDVHYRDPRDLFMGHYVQLSINGGIPEALEGIPKNYLNYYCDQRYAQMLDRGVLQGNAELDVCVWRGNALASELRINGMPAYEYIGKEREKQKLTKKAEPQRVAERAEKGWPHPQIGNVLSVESIHNHPIPSQGRVVIVGANLNWNHSHSDEGFFFVEEGSTNAVPCEIVEVFKKETGYLLRPSSPLTPKKRYTITLNYRKNKDLLSVKHWVSFRIQENP